MIRGRPIGIRYGGAFIWLAFILFPLANALSGPGPPARYALAVAGAAAFVAAYVALVLSFRQSFGGHGSVWLLAVLVSLAAALTLFEQSGWGFLFTYCAACAAVLSGPTAGFVGVLVCAALAAACSLIAGANAGQAFGFAATCLGIGLMMLLLRDLRDRNRELTEARAELARLAVAEERTRFARDLHDLLGHTLSVIALKAELAGRLLPGDPDRAAAEIGDVEGVARRALSDVREAVSGYRQPTLDGELAGARMALSAAGIEAVITRPSVTLDPTVEAVLAWAVREGATNVIRHSTAKRCSLLVTAGLGEAGVEVLDDGASSDGDALSRGSGMNGAGGADGGNGLAGLRERVGALHGSMSAGPRAGGGYRLAVNLPSSGAPS
jgi:two-component system sensor histidine kinase DesK